MPLKYVFATFGALALVTVSLNACTSHRITVAQPVPTVTSEGENFGQESSKAFVFGTVQPKTEVKCDTNIIAQVTIKRDFGQALLSLVTLGIYQPATVIYQCGTVPVTAGSTDS